MRIFLALFVFCGLAVAQIPNQPLDHYVATANTTALTIQQPAANARQITFGDVQNAGASVYCASAQTATISWGGTAATATAGSELKILGTQQPSGVTVWTGSNVGAGTTGPVYNVAAGQTLLVSLSWFHLGTQGTSENLTVMTSGTCTITFLYGAI